MVSHLCFCSKQNDASVDEAVRTLHLYLKSEKVVSIGTKDGGRELYRICDDADAVRHSRVHAIAVNRHKKQVDVVFRGTTNGTISNALCDWMTNLNAFWKVRDKN